MGLMSEKEVAEMLNVSRGTLRAWRWKDKGPNYFIVGTRTVRYSLEEVNKFLLGANSDAKNP
jgi:excisionase family DNA binding protein